MRDLGWLCLVPEERGPNAHAHAHTHTHTISDKQAFFSSRFHTFLAWLLVPLGFRVHLLSKTVFGGHIYFSVTFLRMRFSGFTANGCDSTKRALVLGTATECPGSVRQCAGFAQVGLSLVPQISCIDPIFKREDIVEQPTYLACPSHFK